MRFMEDNLIEIQLINLTDPYAYKYPHDIWLLGGKPYNFTVPRLVDIHKLEKIWDGQNGKYYIEVRGDGSYCETTRREYNDIFDALSPTYPTLFPVLVILPPFKRPITNAIKELEI